MGKWKEYKSYLTSPPAEVIAKVEYRSHFLNIFGIIVVCIILVLKSYWWAIFGIIFSIGVSWAQGMAALARYKIFRSFLPDETWDLILEDKSFTRKRQRLLNKRYNRFVRWLILPSCFFIVLGIVGLRPITIDWKLKIFKITILVISKYVILIAISTLLFYFIFTYLLIAKLIELSKRGEKEKRDGLEKEPSQAINT